MFQYPKQAEVNRVLPKNKIYAHAKASSALQRKFVDQAEKIVWRYKLAPETVNLPPAKHISEIQVFDLHLKQRALHEDVLRAIDRTIRHPIAFQLILGEEWRFAMAHKRPSDATSDKWVVGEYFSTDWRATEAVSKDLPVVLNMAALHEQLLRAHFSTPARPNESLQGQMARITELQQKQREASKLESRLSATKQFNRKVELNRELKAMIAQIENLRTI